MQLNHFPVALLLSEQRQKFSIRKTLTTGLKIDQLCLLSIDMWSQGFDLTTLNFPHRFETQPPDPTV